VGSGAVSALDPDDLPHASTERRRFASFFFIARTKARRWRFFVWCLK
jgi:hypothetical protein